MASSGPCDVQGETLLGLTLQGLHGRGARGKHRPGTENRPDCY